MLACIRHKIASSVSSTLRLNLKRGSKVIHNICNQGFLDNPSHSSITLMQSRSYSSNNEAVVPYMGESIIDKVTIDVACPAFGVMKEALYLRRSKAIHINQGLPNNSRPLRKIVSHLQMDNSTLVGRRSYSSDSGEKVEAVVPYMGESITNGTVATFLKKPGDHVGIDEPFPEVETDKVTSDVTSPESGIIQEFSAKEGDSVEPQAKITISSKCPGRVTHVAPPEKPPGKYTYEPASSEKEVDKPMPNEETLLPEEKPKSPSPPPKPSASEPKIGGRTEVLPATMSIANAMCRNLANTLNRDNEEKIAEGTTVWDLRLICEYGYKNEKLQIKNVTIHGFWPGHIENGKVVHDNNKCNPDNALAKQLLEELTDRHPDIRAKMEKYWVSINHTSSPETIWYHEMCKHGTMDYEYWIKTINAASQFFAEDGTCRLLDMMKAIGYKAGCYSTKDFQSDMGIMIGREIHTTYKKRKGKTYLHEYAFLFDKTTNFMLNYPEQELDAEEFLIEEHQGSG